MYAGVDRVNFVSSQSINKNYSLHIMDGKVTCVRGDKSLFFQYTYSFSYMYYNFGPFRDLYNNMTSLSNFCPSASPAPTSAMYSIGLSAALNETLFAII